MPVPSKPTRLTALLALCLLPVLWGGAEAGIFDVTNLSDADPGSLRDVVTQANTGGGSNEIDWTTGAAGTIGLASDLSINGSTLLDVTGAGAGSAISNSAGGVVLSGAVTFQNNAVSTFTITSAVGGTGSFTKTGSGVLVLSGANSYTGGTAINGGVLFINGDAALGDAAGAISFDGGTLRSSADMSSARSIVLNAGGGTVDTNSRNLSLTGVISGGGALTKTGNGTLALSGINTYGGATTVNAGTLLLGVDGALPAGTALTVGAGAALDVGSHIQTVQNFNVAGLTKIVLQPATPSLTVTGAANLGGALQITLRPQVVLPGQTFTPIAAASTAGTFSSIVSPAALIFSPDYASVPGSVVLTAGLVPFSNIAATDNQRAVGKALEPLRAAPTGDAATVIGNLYTLDAPGFKSAMDQIGPMSLSTPKAMGVLQSDVLSAAVDNRVSMLSDGFGRPAPSSDAFVYQPAGSPWGAFASGVLGASYLREQADAPEAALHTGGLLMGADWSTDHSAVGLLGGYMVGSSSLYSSTATDVPSVGRGTVDQKSVRGGLYAASHGERYRTGAYAGLAGNGFTMKRNLRFGDLSRKATGDTRGREINLHTGGEWDAVSGGWGILSPGLGLNYDRFHVGGFTEQGADDLDLKVAPQDPTSLRSSLTLRYGNRHDGESTSLASYVLVGWRHEFMARGKVDAELASGDGDAFSVTDEETGQNGLLTGVGLSFFWSDRRGAAYIEYSGDYHPLSQQQLLRLGIHWSF